MSYTLTDADVTLLANIAGGFNYSRVGLPPAQRFNSSVLWANADALNALVERASSKPPPDPNPPIPGLPSAPYRIAFTVAAEPFSFQINGPARAAVAVLDGTGVCVGYSAGPSPEFVEGRASCGNATALVMVPAGAWWIHSKLADPAHLPVPGDVYCGVV